MEEKYNVILVKIEGNEGRKKIARRENDEGTTRETREMETRQKRQLGETHGRHAKGENNEIVENDEIGDIVDYLPTKPLNSVLINYEQFAQFWKMVPSYVRIRIP